MKTHRLYLQFASNRNTRGNCKIIKKIMLCIPQLIMHSQWEAYLSFTKNVFTVNDQAKFVKTCITGSKVIKISTGPLK